MRQQPICLQNVRNNDYYGDPYFYTASNYRYNGGGVYYETNQYGANLLLGRFLFPRLRFWKVLSDSCSNLSIGHLVNGFNTNYLSAERFTFEALFKLGLCLAGTKYQDGFGITNTRYYMIIVFIEMAGKAIVSLVLCRVLLW